MKTIVISGARSNVGKTTLAERLRALLPGAVCVKLGHGDRKKGVGNVFYHAGTTFERIARENSGAGFLIIESNRILQEMEPDLAVYLPAPDPKPSAALAESRADLTRGCEVDGELAAFVAGRLGIDIETAGEVARLACEQGGPGTDCDDGV